MDACLSSNHEQGVSGISDVSLGVGGSGDDCESEAVRERVGNRGEVGGDRKRKRKNKLKDLSKKRRKTASQMVCKLIGWRCTIIDNLMCCV